MKLQNDLKPGILAGLPLQTLQTPFQTSLDTTVDLLPFFVLDPVLSDPELSRAIFIEKNICWMVNASNDSLRQVESHSEDGLKMRVSS